MPCPIDARGRLEVQPFSYSISKSQKVSIAYEGRVVTILSGKQAERFLRNVEGADAAQAQLCMARATGNFKRGNEREAKQQPR